MNKEKNLYHFYITIPVRKDSSEVLENLKSLLNQRGADPDTYTIIYLISNSKKEAEKRTEVFLDNQQSANILERYYQSLSDKLPSLKVFTKIRVESAPLNDNIGLARRELVSIVENESKTRQDGPEVIVITLDADTIVKPNFIVNLKHLFSSNKDAVAMCGKIKYRDMEKIPTMEFMYFKAFDKAYALLKNEPQVSAQSFAFELSAYNKVGGFKPMKGGEDIELAKRLIAHGKVLFPKEMVTYPRIRYSNRCNGNGQILYNIHKVLINNKIPKFQVGRKNVTIDELIDLVYKRLNPDSEELIKALTKSLKKDELSLKKYPNYKILDLHIKLQIIKVLEKYSQTIGKRGN